MERKRGEGEEEREGGVQIKGVTTTDGPTHLRGVEDDLLHVLQPHGTGIGVAPQARAEKRHGHQQQ